MANLIKPSILVLFDFDGTLANTNPLIIETFHQVFKKNFPDLEINKKMELSFIGPTLHDTFSKYLAVDNVETYVNEYRDINMRMQLDSLAEVKGATKVLKHLTKQDVQLGIVSSKMKDSLMLGINILDLEQYLSVIIGGDEVVRPKPDSEGLNLALKKLNRNFDYLFYVGDTKTDVMAAKKANFESIAIITTPHFEDDIKALEPEYIIYDLLEVVKIVEERLDGKL